MSERPDPLDRVVRSVCPLDCPDTCSMVVTIRDGIAIQLKGDKDHPFTRGFLCQKMAGYLERVYCDDRLLYPMRRVGPKGPGRGHFERISWDEALDLIATRFNEIARGPHGPEAILPYSYYGTMGKIQAESLDRRFFHRLGATILDRTICATAGTVGYEATVGQGRLGADPLCVPECKFVINWGSNTAKTNSHLWSLMIEARKRGATLVTIDPYRSATASRSEWHIQIRPGTDAALALGMMHVIWRDKLHDQDYINRATIGAKELRERVLHEYTLDRVSKITDLDIRTIEELGRRYATTHPSLIRLNYGLQRHGGGGMAVRTIACLPAVVGAWKFAGGGALLTTSGAYGLNSHALTRPDLAPANTRVVNMNHLAEALGGELPGPPILGLYVYNSNPAAVAPDQVRVLHGLSRPDLFTVVHELVATDTLDYADVVLPATSQLEHEDIHSSYGHYFVMHNPRAIPPRGECRSNADVFRALSKRMGMEEHLFPDNDTLMRQALEGGPTLNGISLERLKNDGSIRLNLPAPFIPFAEGEFPTPSGRCEFVAESLSNIGIDPIPTYTPPHEDPQTRPELSMRFPIQLLSPPRAQFLNSTFAGSSTHRAHAGNPSIEISDQDAIQRELQNGDWAEVYNDRGRFLAQVSRTGAVRPGVAVASGIYWSKLVPGASNANATTSTALTDLGGGATFFDNLVEIRRHEAPIQKSGLNQLHAKSDE